jgi:uncharacterized protein (TIGR02118 family)
MYPRAEGSTFDIDYYLATHIPLAERLLGDACKAVTVDEGVGGGNPAPYHCITTMTFDSVEAFGAAMGGATELMDDMKNFTNAAPQIQMSEVRR